MDLLPHEQPVEHHRAAAIGGVALLVVIALGAYAYVHISSRALTTAVSPVATSTGTTAVSGRPTSLPAGFPPDIPVERAGLTESYSTPYAAQHVTQYSVSYTSSQSKDAVWKTYTDFLASAGYTTDAKATSKAAGLIVASKGGNDLNVVITSHGQTTLVQISYIER